MKDSYKLRKTKELAEQSSFVKINGRVVKVGASVYMGNRFISDAVNSNKTNPKVVQYNSVLPFDKTPFLHAEMSALIKASKIIDTKDFKYCTLFIARKLNCNGYGMARPCPACREAIRQFGIKRVIYTTDEGSAVEYFTDEEL